VRARLIVKRAASKPLSVRSRLMGRRAARAVLRDVQPTVHTRCAARARHAAAPERRTVDLPIQPLLLSLPSAITVLRRRRRGQRWGDALAAVGWRGAGGRDLLLGALVAGAGALLALLVYRLLPPEAVTAPGVAARRYAGAAPGPALFLRALLYEALYAAWGEESFFRGWLQGWAERRWGFRRGNALQAGAFLLPHLILLAISPALWPVLPLVLAGGWANGWLRHRSGSILPGLLAHSVANATAAVAAAALAA
jgi:membrane protease YdiL (CAAX protease family)